MNEAIYYIATERGASATEEPPKVGGKAAVVCERYHLAEEGETLESIDSSDLALLLDARTDVDYRRVGIPPGPRTIDKSEFLGGAVTRSRAGDANTIARASLEIQVRLPVCL